MSLNALPRGQVRWKFKQAHSSSHSPWHRFGFTRRKRCLFLFCLNVLCILTASLFILPSTPSFKAFSLAGSYWIFTTPWNGDYENNFINEEKRLTGREKQNSPRDTTQVPVISLRSEDLGMTQQDSWPFALCKTDSVNTTEIHYVYYTVWPKIEKFKGKVK